MKLKSATNQSQSSTSATTNDPFFDLLLNDISSDKPNAFNRAPVQQQQQTTVKKEEPQGDKSPSSESASTPNINGGTESPLQDRKISSSAEPQPIAPSQSTTDESVGGEKTDENESSPLDVGGSGAGGALLSIPVDQKPLIPNPAIQQQIRPPITNLPSEFVNNRHMNIPVSGGFQPRMRPPINMQIPQMQQPQRPNLILTGGGPLFFRFLLFNYGFKTKISV